MYASDTLPLSRARMSLFFSILCWLLLLVIIISITRPGTRHRHIRTDR